MFSQNICMWRDCFARCSPGYYERFECFHDCITKGYDDGNCVPGPKTGRCCCTR
uniref:Putative defensin-like protein 53 n=1 Tax=Arabidopsis thaliana TaxID=3702 RepID=DEF53_ARATH|nr:PUTATIVE PSEUDOGENE: RecName: Full=Putative defensin-like protein 53 [Arabidopsis thaliana]